MNIGARAAREPLEEIGHQFDLEISHSDRTNPCIHNGSGASTEVNSGQT
jgi:hypothetical protein